MIENSILILNHNRSDLSRLCVDSILPYRNEETTEMILLENGSRDDSKELFSGYANTYKHIRVVDFPDPVSLMEARNKGLELAQGSYILSLDNDTTWQGNVLEELKKPMEHNQTIGIVGMCGVYIASLDRYIHIHQQRYTKDLPADATTGYCMLIKKELVRNGIRFDESLSRYLGEDIDFCLQAREHGYSVFVKANTPLVHLEHGTMKFVNGEYSDLMGKNHERLAEKWQKRFRLNPDMCAIPLDFVVGNAALVLTLDIRGIRFYDIVG